MLNAPLVSPQKKSPGGAFFAKAKKTASELDMLQVFVYSVVLHFVYYTLMFTNILYITTNKITKKITKHNIFFHENHENHENQENSTK